MKIIELLTKIANGEEVPKKIKFKNTLYTLIEYGISTRLYQSIEPPYEVLEINTTVLNDEIEVIEEDKKIEKIDLDWVEVFDFKEQSQQDCVKTVFYKINEIIDYINKENKE